MISIILRFALGFCIGWSAFTTFDSGRSYNHPVDMFIGVSTLILWILFNIKWGV